MAEKPPEDSPGQEMQEFKSSLLSSLLKYETTKRDQQIRKLEQLLSEEKYSRNQERFLGILVVLIWFNIVFLTPMQSWGGPISILILELIALVLLARGMGLEDASKIIDRILASFPGGSRGDD